MSERYFEGFAAGRATGGSTEPLTVDVTHEDNVVRLFDRAVSPGDGRDPADLAVFNADNR
jgi:hypothetical protein